jgi:hypothetical protein
MALVSFAFQLPYKLSPLLRSDLQNRAARILAIADKDNATRRNLNALAAIVAGIA